MFNPNIPTHLWFCFGGTVLENCETIRRLTNDVEAAAFSCPFFSCPLPSRMYFGQPMSRCGSEWLSCRAKRRGPLDGKLFKPAVGWQLRV